MNSRTHDENQASYVIPEVRSIGGGLIAARSVDGRLRAVKAHPGCRGYFPFDDVSWDSYGSGHLVPIPLTGWESNHKAVMTWRDAGVVEINNYALGTILRKYVYATNYLIKLLGPDVVVSSPKKKPSLVAPSLAPVQPERVYPKVNHASTLFMIPRTDDPGTSMLVNMLTAKLGSALHVVEYPLQSPLTYVSIGRDMYNLGEVVWYQQESSDSGHWASSATEALRELIARKKLTLKMLNPVTAESRERDRQRGLAEIAARNAETARLAEAARIESEAKEASRLAELERARRHQEESLRLEAEALKQAEETARLTMEGDRLSRLAAAEKSSLLMGIGCAYEAALRAQALELSDQRRRYIEGCAQWLRYTSLPPDPSPLPYVDLNLPPDDPPSPPLALRHSELSSLSDPCLICASDSLLPKVSVGGGICVHALPPEPPPIAVGAFSDASRADLCSVYTQYGGCPGGGACPFLHSFTPTFNLPLFPDVSPLFSPVCEYDLVVFSSRSTSPVRCKVIGCWPHFVVDPGPPPPPCSKKKRRRRPHSSSSAGNPPKHPCNPASVPV